MSNFSLRFIHCRDSRTLRFLWGMRHDGFRFSFFLSLFRSQAFLILRRNYIQSIQAFSSVLGSDTSEPKEWGLFDASRFH